MAVRKGRKSAGLNVKQVLTLLRLMCIVISYLTENTVRLH